MWAAGGWGRGGGLAIEGLFFEESSHVKLKIYLTQGRMWKGIGKSRQDIKFYVKRNRSLCITVVIVRETEKKLFKLTTLQVLCCWKGEGALWYF